MKIQRTINGVVFNIQLLPEEMNNAFYEQQRHFDIEDIVSYAEELTNEELEKELGCDYSTYLSKKEDMAKLMRQYIDNGMGMPEARELAVGEVIKRTTAASLA